MKGPTTDNGPRAPQARDETLHRTTQPKDTGVCQDLENTIVNTDDRREQQKVNFKASKGRREHQPMRTDKGRHEQEASEGFRYHNMESTICCQDLKKAILHKDRNKSYKTSSNGQRQSDLEEAKEAVAFFGRQEWEDAALN